jgi:hypothetical protein
LASDSCTSDLAEPEERKDHGDGQQEDATRPPAQVVTNGRLDLGFGDPRHRAGEGPNGQAHHGDVERGRRIEYGVEGEDRVRIEQVSQHP